MHIEKTAPVDLPMCITAIVQIDHEKFHVYRRGSAWGLAGLVKGMGIGSLRNFGILERIKEATEDQVRPHNPCLNLFLCC